MAKQKLKKQTESAIQKEKSFKNKMECTFIETLNGRRRFSELADIGCAKRIQYFNMVNKPDKKHPQPDYIQKVIHDLGLVFSDGAEIRHVESVFFNYFNGTEITEIK